jgi:hypothetical protein
MLDFLHEATLFGPLPDAYFHLTCSDWPMAHRSSWLGSPVLSMNTGDSHWDIPVPGHSHPPRGGFDATPWEERTPKALWRGTLMCESSAVCKTRCSRIQIRLAAQLHPDLLDVRFTHMYKPLEACVVALVANLSEYEDPAQSFIPIQRLSRWKYLIASGGHSYSTGFKGFLSTGAVVFRERTQFLEYFEPSLVPWREYIPFDCRDAKHDCRLVDLVRQAHDNDDAFRAIGERARRFSLRHFTRAGRSSYWHNLLARLQSLYVGRRGSLDAAVESRVLRKMQPFRGV